MIGMITLNEDRETLIRKIANTKRKINEMLNKFIQRQVHCWDRVNNKLLVVKQYNNHYMEINAANLSHRDHLKILLVNLQGYMSDLNEVYAYYIDLSKKDWDNKWILYNGNNVITVTEPRIDVKSVLIGFINEIKLLDGEYELMTVCDVYKISVKNNKLSEITNVL
jgi:hypothetical protein